MNIDVLTRNLKLDSVQINHLQQFAARLPKLSYNEEDEYDSN